MTPAEETLKETEPATENTTPLSAEELKAWRSAVTYEQSTGDPKPGHRFDQRLLATIDALQAEAVRVVPVLEAASRLAAAVDVWLQKGTETGTYQEWMAVVAALTKYRAAVAGTGGVP